jgi:hypothetical protein
MLPLGDILPQLFSIYLDAAKNNLAAAMNSNYDTRWIQNAGLLE